MGRTFFVDCSLLFILLHSPICFPSMKYFDIIKNYFCFYYNLRLWLCFFINGIGALIGAHFLADDERASQTAQKKTPGWTETAEKL